MIRLTNPARPLFTLLITAAVAAPAGAQDNIMCLECHGSLDLATVAVEMFELQVSHQRLQRLVVLPPAPKAAHQGLACVDCHPAAEELPHPEGMLAEFNPCVVCHDDAADAINASSHRDVAGGSAFRAQCWACHGAHDVRPASDPLSALAPAHVAGRCLACHDKQEYLSGVHGFGVQKSGLDFSATCVSCHGGHEILGPEEAGSRVKRRQVSFTCGRCHGRLAETYRASVHGAALEEDDNPDVPTCVDCHEAHGTRDPRMPRFRISSPQICARCHEDPEMMGRYGLSTQVMETYVADFHGTTAELFRATSPDAPLNQAVCYDCHGYHDVESVRRVGQEMVQARLLVRCQACHPGIDSRFLSAWTGHYVPSRDRFPIIFYVNLFYRLVIPGTVGFFLVYIAVDVWGRRRRGRVS